MASAGLRSVLPVLLMMTVASLSLGTEPEVRIEPAVVTPGTPVRILVSGVPPSAQVSGRLLERELVFIPGTDGGRMAFAGVDLDVAPGAYNVQVSAEGGSLLEYVAEIVVTAKEYPTEELKVASRYVEPPAEVSARIARESAALEKLWQTATEERLFDGVTVRPLPEAAGRNFGRRRVFNGQPRSPHSGTDLSASEGTPVPASARGRVALAEDLYFSGNLVVLEHGGGVYTLYAHLSRMDVSAGDMVDAGQTIGLVGATGRVTGAHLHWGARIGAARVDPAALLEQLSSR